ncbi:hypothetical protein KHA80_21965 [Anaerobacillus sp. HL2]|nr:hypothetical protein KHA80_21965 [Anaerobacillus sp. HL2]
MYNKLKNNNYENEGEFVDNLTGEVAVLDLSFEKMKLPML